MGNGIKVFILIQLPNMVDYLPHIIRMHVIMIWTEIKVCIINSIEAREYCLFTIYGYEIPFPFFHSEL